MARKKTRSYNVKKTDLISYEDIAGRIEELKVEAGWKDDADGTAEEKFDAFFECSCTLVGSEGKSDNELQDAQEILETLTEMAPGLTDATVKEFKKYCHRQAMYDTFVAPVEENIQPLMDGEDLSETMANFSNAIQNYGQSVFDDMKALDDGQDKLSQRWKESQDEVKNTFDEANNTSQGVKDRLANFDMDKLKEAAVEKATDFANAGGDAAGAAAGFVKRSASKALTLFSRKPQSPKFDEMFEEATALVDSFRSIREEMRVTNISMKDIVEKSLEPMLRNAQDLKTEQLEIIRKLDYQIEAGKELVRIFEEDVLPEVTAAEKSGEELDPLQEEGFKEIRKGHKDFVARLSLLASQKQEAAARTQAMEINTTRFEELVKQANTYNNVISTSMKQTMRALESGLNSLDLSLQAAKRNNMANDMFEDLVRVIEIGQQIQANTNPSVDPELILEVRNSLNTVSHKAAVQKRLEAENHKSQLLLMEAADDVSKAAKALEHDDSDDALATYEEAKEKYQEAEEMAKQAAKNNRQKLENLDAKDSKKPESEKPTSAEDAKSTKGKFSAAAKQKAATQDNSAEAKNDNEAQPSAASKFSKKKKKSGPQPK